MTGLRPGSTPPSFPPTASARPPIRRSWQRCAQLAPAMPDEPVTLARADLQTRFEQHACVLQAAQPEIDTLAGMVASASSLVLLADASGVILQATGNTGFLRRAEQVALRPGVSWAENHRGTNAIGTALVEAAALRVHGGEHFLARNQILSCHAAPIRSPRGDILGVLDISGDAGRWHAYALGLASMCARQVANRVIENAGAGLRQLVFHRQASLLDSVERGLLLVEDERIVGANEAAVALLGESWAGLLDAPVARWLERWRGLGGEPAALHGPGGAVFHARLREQPGERAPRVPVAARSPAPPAPAARPAREPGVPQLEDRVLPALERARRALDGGLAVLVTGETGTGKEVFARHLHRASSRRDGPFVAVNCGALPESLVEAELFGYEAGAYTGARRHGARGLLREADGGVLFLDEIGDMPLALQTRLLRVLQERVVQPLGAARPVPVDFAVVSATHRDLDAMMAAGAFRPDLFYRLQDYAVTLPPLRTRADLRAHVCAALRAAAEAGAPALTLADDAVEALVRHAWPGNYRELHAALRGLVLFHPPGSVIHARDLPAAIHAGASRPLSSGNDTAAAAAEPPAQRPLALREALGARIAAALVRANGNVAAAARELGVHRSTVYRWRERGGPAG